MTDTPPTPGTPPTPPIPPSLGAPPTSDRRTSRTTPSLSRGVFITFEGGDGVGKTTHLRLLAARLEANGLKVVRLREPGGTAVGEQVRSILLNPENTDLSPVAELLLYESARAQLVLQVIIPALAEGAVVLCDRYTDSTVAYQGFGRGLGLSLVEQANRIATQGVAAHRTVLLVDQVDAALARAREQGADRMEAAGLDFHRRVSEGFLQLAADDPERIRIIHLDEDRRVTAERVLAAVADLFDQPLSADFDIDSELSD